MKILRNLCLHFARQDGQDGKQWKENHATKVTKMVSRPCAFYELSFNFLSWGAYHISKILCQVIVHWCFSKLYHEEKKMWTIIWNSRLEIGWAVWAP